MYETRNVDSYWKFISTIFQSLIANFAINSTRAHFRNRQSYLHSFYFRKDDKIFLYKRLHKQR